MKSKEIKDLQTKTIEELQKLLVDARAAFFTLQLDNSQHKLKDTRSLFWKRKEIARIATAIQGKENVK